jgi:hypothetical protein
VHGDLCVGVNDLIPDTNGRGGARGAAPGGGGGGGGGAPGGAPSRLRTFFLFLFVGGAAAVAGGLTWTHCLAPAQREALADRAASLLGALGTAFELGLGFVVEAYDWARARLRALPFPGGGGGGRGGGGFDARGAYEPLGESGGGLDLDLEDHRSPPLFGTAEP